MTPKRDQKLSNAELDRVTAAGGNGKNKGGGDGHYAFATETASPGFYNSLAFAT